MSATEKTGTHTWAEQEAAIGNAKTSAAMLAAIGMTADQVAALGGANAPSGTNVVATMADIPDVPEIPSQANMPTSDQKAAMAGTSGTPSASNPYATKATTDAEASARTSGDALALKIASNLSDLNNAATARTNLGLGDSATKSIGTTTGTVAAGNDSRIVAGGTALQPTGDGSGLTGITQSQVSGLPTTLSLKADLVDGTVLASQLPSYVDDILEVANYAALPTTGETGKIYVTLDTNLTYRWSGTAYVEISASLALGETSSTAYRGDRGKTAYDHSQDTTSNPHAVTKAQVGLGNVNNTADAEKPLSNAALAALALKAPLASPALTGTPTAPTAAAGTSTTQIVTCAFLQSELDDLIPFSPILSKTGDGTGVATLTVTLSAPTTVRLDGYGYFYTDSGGTTGETQKKRLAAGTNTLYIKVKKSSAVLTFLQCQRMTRFDSWSAGTNAPSISFSLADLPSGVTYVGISGRNTCTYNTASGSRTWASGMRQVYCRSTTTTSLTSAMIDAILIDLSAQATWSNERSVSLKGTRTSASDAAVSTLTGYGVVVTVTA